MSDAEKTYESVYGDSSSEVNRASWLATVGSIFDGFGGRDTEEDKPSTSSDPITPSSTYDEAGIDLTIREEMPEVAEPSDEVEVEEVPTDNTVAIDIEDLEDIIRNEASLRNIDPEIAIRLWRAEGGGSYQSNVEREGSGSLNGREASFGPFQLFTGGGLGNDYERLTGRELVNDNTLEGITKQVQFALDMAVERGWTPWYGRRTAGISPRQGLANAVQVNNWQDS
jgi:hypothetical protein